MIRMNDPTWMEGKLQDKGIVNSKGWVLNVWATLKYGTRKWRLKVEIEEIKLDKNKCD